MKKIHNTILLMLLGGLTVFLLSGCIGATICANDAEIITAIAGKREVQEQDITLFASKDVDGKRFVGYHNTKDDVMGYAVLQTEGDKGYRLEDIIDAEQMTNKGNDILVGYYKNYWVALSGNDQLSNIHYDFGSGQPMELEIITYPALAVLILPTDDQQGQYRFYDKSGALMN